MDKRNLISKLISFLLILAILKVVNGEIIELEREIDYYKEEVTRLNEEIDNLEQKELDNYKELVSELEDTIKRNR